MPRTGTVTTNPRRNQAVIFALATKPAETGWPASGIVCAFALLSLVGSAEGGSKDSAPPSPNHQTVEMTVLRMAGSKQHPALIEPTFRGQDDRQHGALCCGFSQMKTPFSSGGIYSVLTVADKNERPKRLTDRREEGSHRSVPIGFLAEKDLRVAAIF